jgi:hypothetical protein
MQIVCITIATSSQSWSTICTKRQEQGTVGRRKKNDEMERILEI